MRRFWPTALRVAAGIALVWGIYWLRGNIYSRLYPVMVSAAAFLAFALSRLTLRARRGRPGSIPGCRRVHSPLQSRQRF